MSKIVSIKFSDLQELCNDSYFYSNNDSTLRCNKVGQTCSVDICPMIIENEYTYHEEERLWIDNVEVHNRVDGEEI